MNNNEQPSPESLLRKNKAWASRLQQQDDEYFSRLVAQQTPSYLWIGCSDSRVPATQIVDLPPGEIFVHRNIANLVLDSDMNCLSVMQFAVDTLKVEHIIVCGHYGCGGVKAALDDLSLGFIDNWLQPIKNLAQQKRKRLDSINNERERWNLLSELNVAQQVENVSRTAIVQQAWQRGQNLSVHGWIYDLQDGVIKDLTCSVTTA